MSSVLNETGESVTVKYQRISVKDATFERFYEYVSKQAGKKKGRFTADNAVNAMLDCVDRAESQK